MRKDDLRGMTRPELLEEARRLEIRGRNAMNKEQLADAVAATVRPKRERASTPPVVDAEPARRPRKTQGAEPAAPARDAKPGGRAKPHVAGTQPAVRPPGETHPSVVVPPLADTPAPSAARPPADMPAPPAARPPADRPHAGMRGHHPPREEEDDDGQNWNSTALGRDPNYGRFLGPGSIPSRNLPPPRRGPGGPPSPVAKSLAERSELGRQRAGERSYGPREDLRRSGTSRRDSAYTPRYERDRRPVDSRVEHGRGRVDEHPGRGPQGVRGPQDGGRGVRPPAGPAIDRKGPMEGRPERDGRRSPVEVRRERDDRRSPGEARHEHDARRALERHSAGAAQVRPIGGPTVPGEARHRSSRDGSRPAAEGPRPRGDSDGDSRSTGSAGVPEIRPRAPEPVAPPPRILDRCRLMVRDPYCVHAYWEVTEESVERITAELAGELDGSRPILRVHGIPVSGDPDEPQAGFFDVDLSADATSAYVDVPRANRGYRVDVGLITARMLFFPLASSNTVITPRDTTSRNTTETWAAPPAAGAPAASEQPIDGVGHANAEPVVGAGNPNGEPVVGVGSSGGDPTAGVGSANGALSTGAAPAAGDPSVSGASGAPRSRRSRAATGKRPDGHALADGSGAGLAGDSGGLAGESDAAVARAGGPEQEVSGVGSSAEDSGAGLAAGLDSDAASGRGLAPAGPGIPPGPTGPDEEGPSPGSVAREPKPFHFVVHTELVVYGAAEPGATLTLQGLPVALRPDGTFSLRFQLPDGEQVLRAVAVSPEGNVERVITPVVTRRTIEQETRRDEA